MSGDTILAIIAVSLTDHGLRRVMAAQTSVEPASAAPDYHGTSVGRFWEDGVREASVHGYVPGPFPLGGARRRP